MTSTPEARPVPLTADDAYQIGMAVVRLVASMQMLGHAIPVHSLDYRHGESDEWTQFVEYFAVVSKRGNAAKEERARLVGYANSRDMMRAAMESSALGAISRGLTGGAS
ncbi:hypothetical protein [Demequina sp. SO4-18]|uniref:hypothetical protein n=1 Tax=Demequina sp. SO4-18 TaxID=3401026 RepID=UPI003B5CD604